MKKLTLNYIPEKAYDFIEKSDYKNKDHLYIILNIISKRPSRIKIEAGKERNFMDIPMEYFIEYLSDQNYRKAAFTFLYDNKIIQTDGLYSKEGGKALGYKFEENFISKIKAVELKSDTLKKKIIQKRNEALKQIDKKFNEAKNYYLKNFKIDFNGALNYINNWLDTEVEKLDTLDKDYTKKINTLILKYNAYFIQIQTIKDGDLYFKKNKTNGRIDTNLTCLKSELKEFIELGEKLYQIDIKNSQPFFLGQILKKSEQYKMNPNFKTEVDIYTNTTSSGVFYEKLIDLIYKTHNTLLDRSEVKNLIFCIFYSKNEAYKKEKSIFNKAYPHIHDWIKKQKERKHNELAIWAQKVESDICIDKILPLLNKNDIDAWTIHDAWIIKEDKLKEAYDIIEAEFMKNYGAKPAFDIKNLKDKKLKAY
jgi:hypothetical protein